MDSRDASTRHGGEQWVCVYCKQPIVPAERKHAVRALLDSWHIGRAHPACKARAIAERRR